MEDLTKELTQWVQSPPDKRDFDKGALLFVRITAKRRVYAQMMAAPQKYGCILYNELSKILKFRLAKLTHQQVVELSAKADNSIKKAESVSYGKRPDHDSLPDEIKAAYVQNYSILQRMKELHMQARNVALRPGNCADSDVYAFVKEIISLDKKRLANWKLYDEYSAN